MERVSVFFQEQLKENEKKKLVNKGDHVVRRIESLIQLFDKYFIQH
jgi:hypothetical protein